MSTLLLGNIVSFTGATVMILIGLIKKKRNILIAQCVQFAVMGAGNLILGGVSGAVSNGVSIVRNIVCMCTAYTMPLKGLFCVIQLVLTWFFGEGGILGWLPFMAACAFTWCLDSKNEIRIKEVIIFGQIVWTVYDFALQNYATMAFDVFTIVTTLIGIWRIKKDAKIKARTA